MKNTKDLLEQLFAQQPVIAQQVETQEVNIFALWPQVLCHLGLSTLANNSNVIDLERRQLRLAVRHSVFLQELKIQQNLWLPALEAALKDAGHPSPSISKVSFRMQDLG